MRTAAAAVALLLALAGCSGQDRRTDVVRVAAASSLQPALDALAPLLREMGVTLQPTYGGSGTFLQQLANGAEYDLFLSADAHHPQQAVERGLAESDDLFAYAVGRCVLWVPEGSPLAPGEGLALLTDPRVRRVAIANPRHAPYGQAAEAALRAAGVHDRVVPKLVVGESVAQAADFVVSGGADAGIVPRSLVVAGPLSGVGRWALLPGAPALEQVGVLLRDGAAARDVRDLLLGERGRRLLTDAGYDLPEA